MTIDRKRLREAHVDLMQWYNISWKKLPINARTVYNAEHDEYDYEFTTVNKKRMSYEGFVALHHRPANPKRQTLWFHEMRYGIRPTWEPQDNDCYVEDARQNQLEWVYDHAMKFAIRNRDPLKQRQFYLRLLKSDFIPEWSAGSGLIFAPTERHKRRRQWALDNRKTVMYKIALKKCNGDKYKASKMVWDELRVIDRLKDIERADRVARYAKKATQGG